VTAASGPRAIPAALRGALWMGGALLSFCIMAVAVRELLRTMGAFEILFYMSAIQVPVSLAPALPGWVAPGRAELPWVVAIGVAGLAAHYCITRSFRIADATLMVPLDFLRLPLIAVVGMMFYGEPLEFSILLGAGAIFAGTYYSIRRESREGQAPV